MSNWFQRGNTDDEGRRQNAQREYDSSIDRQGHMRFGTRQAPRRGTTTLVKERRDWQGRKDSSNFSKVQDFSTRHESLSQKYREDSRKRQTVEMLLAKDKRPDSFRIRSNEDRSSRSSHLPKQFDASTGSFDRDSRIPHTVPSHLRRKRAHSPNGDSRFARRQPLLQLIRPDASIDEILFSLRGADRSELDEVFVKCIEENLWQTALNFCEAHRLGAIVLPAELVQATLATLLQSQRHTDTIQFFLDFNVKWYKLPVEIYTNLFELCTLDSVEESSRKNGGDWLVEREGSHLFPFPTEASTINFVHILLRSMERHNVFLTSDPDLSRAALRCLCFRDWDKAWELYQRISSGELDSGNEAARNRFLPSLRLLKGSPTPRSRVPVDLDGAESTGSAGGNEQKDVVGTTYRHLLPAALVAAAKTSGIGDEQSFDSTSAPASKEVGLKTTSHEKVVDLISNTSFLTPASRIYDDMKICAPMEVIPALLASLALETRVADVKSVGARNFATKLSQKYLEERNTDRIKGDMKNGKKPSILDVGRSKMSTWELALQLYSAEIRTDSSLPDQVMESSVSQTLPSLSTIVKEPLISPIQASLQQHEPESIESLSRILLRELPSSQVVETTTTGEKTRTSTTSIVERVMGLALMQQFGTATQESRSPHSRSSLPAQTALKVAQTLYRKRAGGIASQFGFQLLRTKNYTAVPLLAATAASAGNWKESSELCARLFALRGSGARLEDSPCHHEYSLVISSCLHSGQWENALFWIDRAHSQGLDLNGTLALNSSSSSGSGVSSRANLENGSGSTAPILQLGRGETTTNSRSGGSSSTILSLTTFFRSLGRNSGEKKHSVAEENLSSQ